MLICSGFTAPLCRAPAVLDAGYRTFDLEVTDAPDFAKLKNSGPFLGLGARF